MLYYGHIGIYIFFNFTTVHDQVVVLSDVLYSFITILTKGTVKTFARMVESTDGIIRLSNECIIITVYILYSNFAILLATFDFFSFFLLLMTFVLGDQSSYAF